MSIQSELSKFFGIYVLFLAFEEFGILKSVAATVKAQTLNMDFCILLLDPVETQTKSNRTENL